MVFEKLQQLLVLGICAQSMHTPGPPTYCIVPDCRTAQGNKPHGKASDSEDYPNGTSTKGGQSNSQTAERDCTESDSTNCKQTKGNSSDSNDAFGNADLAGNRIVRRAKYNMY